MAPPTFLLKSVSSHMLFLTLAHECRSHLPLPEIIYHRTTPSPNSVRYTFEVVKSFRTRGRQALATGSGRRLQGAHLRIGSGIRMCFKGGSEVDSESG